MSSSWRHIETIHSTAPCGLQKAKQKEISLKRIALDFSFINKDAEWIKNIQFDIGAKKKKNYKRGSREANEEFLNFFLDEQWPATNTNNSQSAKRHAFIPSLCRSTQSSWIRKRQLQSTSPLHNINLSVFFAEFFVCSSSKSSSNCSLDFFDDFCATDFEVPF